jgi:selenide,water dikinase
VYVWEKGPALVQTVDFFTPIVDDPYTYGEIAAANALSDVYAMGGAPLTALAIAAFPKKGLDTTTIGRIFQGGYDKLREAGVALLGGHTVQDDEIKFGYAVTGSIDPARILTNAGAKPGDVLLLTKPIGTGVVGTAIKFSRAPQQTVDEAVASMRTLNAAAARVLASYEGVHACTDVTGFGLIGHATEIALASNVTLALQSAEVPVFAGVFELVVRNRSGGMATNQEHFGATVQFRPDVPDVYHDLLHDPQTSGGLLVAIDETQAAPALQALVAAGVPAARIGAVVRGFDMKVIVR